MTHSPPWTPEARRALIREMLAAEIADGIITRRGLVALLAYCKRLDLDHHATCIVVGRLKADLGERAWGKVQRSVVKAEAGRRDRA